MHVDQIPGSTLCFTSCIVLARLCWSTMGLRGAKNFTTFEYNDIAGACCGVMLNAHPAR